MLIEKPRSNEHPQQSLGERSESSRKKDRPSTDVAVPLEPHWVELIDGATD
jgi:hypothetical protein